MRNKAFIMAGVLAGLLGAQTLFATEVNVVGLFPGKAVIAVNGGAPQTLTAGQPARNGVRLISSTSSEAVLEIDGKRRTLGMGQSLSIGGGVSNGSGPQTAVLTANGQGHFFTTGSINGNSTRMVVDTGATSVSLSGAEARRLGIEYRNGERGVMSTANGNVQAYRVSLNTVKVGDIVLNQVDGIVVEGSSPPVTLLGMSFLNRVEMKREGDSMTLRKRY
jgi:aspartyl protease family protein